MRRIYGALLVLAGLAGPAWAQADGTDEPAAEAAVTRPLPQLGMVRGDAYVEGRIAFLKAELKLDVAQATAFAPVEEAMRAIAKAREAAPPRLGRRPALPARLTQQEATLKAELEAVTQLKAVLVPFYETLTEPQKATADALFALLP